MSLRIVDADLQLNQAFDLFERTLKAWAGGRTDEWRTDGPAGIVEEGATYARRDDVYVSVAMTDAAASIAVALVPGDVVVLEIALPRRGPARDRRRAALAVDDNGETFLLAAEEALRAQGVRDAFRRMAGHAAAKRARVGGRDYLMLGPLGDPAAVDALLALAALHPTFEAHLDRLARLDAPTPATLYRPAETLAHAHRFAEKAAFALAARLRAADYEIVTAATGPFVADVAGRRDDVAIAAHVTRAVTPAAIAEALGVLGLAAPAQQGFFRLLIAPAPRDSTDANFAAFADAAADLDIALVCADIRDDEVQFQAIAAVPSGVARLLA